MSSAPASDKKKKKDIVSSSKKKKKRDHERTAVLSGLDTISEDQDQDDEKDISIRDQLEKESQDQDEDDQESEPEDDETEEEDITLRDVVSALNNMQDVFTNAIKSLDCRTVLLTVQNTIINYVLCYNTNTTLLILYIAMINIYNLHHYRYIFIISCVTI